MTRLPTPPALDDQAWYRLVNDGYAIDGQVVQGTHTFFTTTLNHDVTVIWRWRLEYAAIVEGGKPNGGSVNDGGRQWLKPGDQFIAVLDSPLDDFASSSGTRLKVTGYSLYDKADAQIGDTIPVTAGSYVESKPLNMTAPVRLKWNWVGEVRYRFDAMSSGLATSVQNSQAFIRIWTGFVPPTPGPFAAGTPGDPIYGIGADYTVWVPVGSKITVGAFYRTEDRRLTMGDFAAPPGGNLTSLGRFVSALTDDTVDAKTARVYTTFATTPTDIHWIYEPTVFRAEIPLGQSFDPANPDQQLVPDLATDGNLKLDGTGPGSTFETKIQSPEGSILSGTALRWDGVGKQLFPVHLGSHRVAWPDASNSGETYLIEVVTAFPGETAALTTPRENENGTRKSPPNYEMVTEELAEVSTDYPAAPIAHYRHLYDPVEARQPPTKLDLSATDEWTFQDMTFAEESAEATANKTSSGVPFNTNGSGRSVLLYSFRPNTDEIANGDLTKEKLAVRIVNSTPLSVINRNNAQLVLGRKALELGSSSTSGGAYGVVQTGGSPISTSVDPGNKFVVDFWLNAKGLKAPAAVSLSAAVTVSGSNTVTCASTSAVVAGMNISGPNIPAGTKITSVADTNTTTLILSNAATASGSGLSLTANNKPVTVMSTGGGGLKVTLDSEASTATATYRGVQVSHSSVQVRCGLASLCHPCLHQYVLRCRGDDHGLLSGRSAPGKRFRHELVPRNRPVNHRQRSDRNSLRFGVDAEPRSGLQLDNFRLFKLGADPLGYLNTGEVRKLRTVRDMTVGANRLRSVPPTVVVQFRKRSIKRLVRQSGNSGERRCRPRHRFRILCRQVGGHRPSGSRHPHRQHARQRRFRRQRLRPQRGFQLQREPLQARGGGRHLGPGLPGQPQSALHRRREEARSRLLRESLSHAIALPNPNVAWPYVATDYNEVIYPDLRPAQGQGDLHRQPDRLRRRGPEGPSAAGLRSRRILRTCRSTTSRTRRCRATIRTRSTPSPPPPVARR